MDWPGDNPQPGDILLLFRDGLPSIKTPTHGPGEAVPEDFLVLLGFCFLFQERDFRAMLIQTVQHNSQMFEGLLKRHSHERPN